MKIKYVLLISLNFLALSAFADSKIAQKIKTAQAEVKVETKSQSKMDIQTQAIDLSEPPFWLMASAVYRDLTRGQKEFYADHIGEKLAAIPKVKKLQKSEFVDLVLNEEAWDKYRLTVSEVCVEKRNEVACKELAELRIKTFEIDVYK